MGCYSAKVCFFGHSGSVDKFCYELDLLDTLFLDTVENC